MSVSVVTTVISLSTLGIATAVFGIDAWIANMLATAVATVPSYQPQPTLDLGPTRRE